MQTSKSSAAPARPKHLTLGVLLVLAGSSSYGLLSTFVKLAYRQGFTTAEVTGAQFIWGALVLTLLTRIFPKGAKASAVDKRNLMLAGTTTGFTSVFYYVAINYIPASIAVVLLMQSIWMGVLFEAVWKKQRPTLGKIVSVTLVLFGTVLATNALDASTVALDVRGLIFGLLSAVSYTCTLAATGGVAAHLSAIKRSQYMLYGGIVVVFAYALLTQLGPYYFDLNLIGADFIRSQPIDVRILGSYGLTVAIFGTIVPPILLNKGFPITGVGLGSIISSIELPFAALVASAVLGERLGASQLLGIAVIIGSVCVLNYRLIRRRSKVRGT